MAITFDIEKIVKYLEKHKSNLSKLYKDPVNIDKLVTIGVLTIEEKEELNLLKQPYEKEIKLKEIVGQKLRGELQSKSGLFNELSLWIIKEWGGIKTANDDDTRKLVQVFINHGEPSFERIASSSKVASFLYPDKKIIYDSRVAYALNWIILSEYAGECFFPIPEGRNAKMLAFDVNVLIRLKYISNYQVKNIEVLDNKQYVNNADKKIFIPKKVAYSELNILVKDIHEKLWEGADEKKGKLYYTEMLLFSIADREVFKDITERLELTIKL